MKKEKQKSLGMVLLSVICLAALLFCSMAGRPLRVRAAEGDSEDTALSLTVELSYDGKAMEGVEVRLFYVGAASGDDIVLEGDFDGYLVTTEDEDSDVTDWNEMALTLAGYAYQDAIEPLETDVTDANGEAYFPADGETLQEGVYLVLTQTFQQDDVTYSVQPFLVALPDEDSGHVTYQVVAEPKVSSRTGKQRLTVLKIWDDSDSTSRPDSVNVTLVNDEGVTWGTVTLNEDNSWRYTFTGLSEDTSWYIVEDVPDGYTVLQTVDGTTIALTNTAEEETADPGEPDTTPEDTDTTTADEDTTTASDENDTTAVDDTTTAEADTTTVASASSDGEETTTTLTRLPQTGTLWWVVPILACCGMVSVLIGVAKKRGQEENE